MILLLLSLLFFLAFVSPAPRLTFSNPLLVLRSADQQQLGTATESPFDELTEHFAKMDKRRIEQLEEKLIRAKEYIHLEYGDIFLNERQLGAILEQFEHEHRRRGEQQPATQRRTPKRSLSADPDALWRRMPIKFRFHESLDFSALQQIVAAIAYWENNTCLTFEHFDEKEPKHDTQQDFVDFFKGEGCYSMIGRYGGRQGVSIGAGCERVGIVEHEIGHVLGLWHEQSRPDAWNYVQVEKEFVLPSYMADFQLHGKDEILTLDIPYDYGSVMHYGPMAFSSDGIKPTLITKNMLYQLTIGQRDRLAFYDVMTINKAYCADKCGGIPQLRSSTGEGTAKKNDGGMAMECQNGGYPNPGRCSECICPSGYGGKSCERNQRPKGAECGGEMKVGMDSWEQLESPAYDGDGYDLGQQCNWVLRSPPGTRILAEFIDDFAMFCAAVCVDYVELKLSNDQRLTGARFCCDQRFPEHLVSEQNQMAVLFRAQLSQDIGFRLRVRATHLPATNQRTGKNVDQRTEESKEALPPTGSNGRRAFLAGKDVWGEWAAWSVCSRPCGGCGIRSRSRSCLSEECPSAASKEFGACNFRACPVRPNCQKVLFLHRACRSSGSSDPSDSDHSPLSEPTAQVCSRAAHQLAECNQPSCCPPFYAVNGKCVRGEQSENEQDRNSSRNTKK